MEDVKKCIIAYWWYKTRKHKNKNRRTWVRPIFTQGARDKFGAGNNLLTHMRINDPEKFRNFLRMEPNAFDNLHQLLKTSISKVDVRRKPIDSTIRLAVTLRYLASGDSMTSLSYLFRLGVSTVSEIITETTAAIWVVLKELYLKPPDQVKWSEIADGFEHLWNFPNCAGAIDGKHISIIAPPHSGSEYYNYKGFHSIVILALVDHNYKFVLVDIGSQGRFSDGGILRSSTIGKLLFSHRLGFPEPKQVTVSKPPLPYVIVGDNAFPLHVNLMKPYSIRDELNVEKAVFNYRLSRARRISENAFGILSSRWRIYSKSMMGTLSNIENIVKATVCLHNFMITDGNNHSYYSVNLVDHETVNGEPVHGNWRIYPTNLASLRSTGSNTYTKDAKAVRDLFKDYFNNEGSVSWQWDRL